MGNYKRVLSIIIAATCMLVFSFSMTFAQTESPTEGAAGGDKVTAKNGYVKGSNSGNYYCNVTKKTATLKSLYNKKVKTIVFNNTITKDGVKCKVTKIDAKAFKGAKKLRTIKIKNKNLKTVSKNAFKGLKKSQLKKIKVKISKKLTKKQFNSLKKQFKKAGIPAKNIKRVKL